MAAMKKRQARNKTFSACVLPADAGIAIGPILFVIAALGLIAALISSNIGSYGKAGVIDRIAADIPSQASLIREKVDQCNLMYGTAAAPVYPVTGGTPTLASALDCPGAPSGLQNLWTGTRPAVFPEQTSGFAAWNYVSNTTGGTCIYTAPTTSNPAQSTDVVEGLQLAARKFGSQTGCANTVASPCTTEAIYDPASASQKFVLWIAMPAAGSSPDPNCQP